MLIVRRRSGRETSRIQQDMEDLFRTMVTGRSFARTNFGSWRPRVEVFASDVALVVTAELAGVSQDDLSVVVDDSTVRINGVRRNPDSNQKRTYYEMGIPYGPFEAEVFLPFSVVLDDVEAVYENGFLRVTLPRPQVTRITPQVADEPAQGHER
jgi:HSP20 family molecular chaperone IbpA